jgi:hypothetical protein
MGKFQQGESQKVAPQKIYKFSAVLWLTLEMAEHGRDFTKAS